MRIARFRVNVESNIHSISLQTLGRPSPWPALHRTVPTRQLVQKSAHRHSRLAACPGGFLELQSSDSPHIGAATTRTDVLLLKCAPSSLGADLSINNFIRFSGKHCFCSFKHFYRLFTRHRRVAFQEIVKPIAGFQILDQDTYGDPGA